MKRVRITAIFLLAILSLSMSIYASSVTSSIMYGDLDSNKKVDLVDLLLMKKKLVNYDVDINTDSADLNVDGNIDLVDLLLMKKYFAGWDVSFGEQVTITFDSSGGNKLEIAKVMSGTSLEELPVPTKSGSTFDCWTLNGTAFDVNNIITSNITLVAKWK